MSKASNTAEHLLPPVPIPDAESQPFWEGCKAGELRMQRCGACQRFRFYPRPMCPHCHSTEREWVAMSGRGTLYSWVVAHPPVLPAFRERAPYNVILVELAEDPALRLVGNLIDTPEERIRIGLPLEVAFVPLSPEITLPQWRISEQKPT